VIRTVALVGASHPAARALAVALEADARVERVLGLSASEPPLLGPKFEYLETSAEQLTRRVRGAGAVVVFPSIDVAARDPDQARVSALESLRQVLAGIDSGTEVVVLWSSAVVYGAQPDNPVPLREGDPLRPNDNFPAAGILADMEGIVLGAATSVRRVVLRAAPVWAPEWGTFTARWLQAPALLGVGGADPPMQALHPDDAASALVLAVAGDLDGVYNVAPADSVPLSQAARLTGRRLVPLPAALVKTGAEQLARAGLTGPPGELDYLSRPWVVDAGRLRAAGWVPKLTTTAALGEAGSVRRDGIAFGRVTVRRQDVYRTVGTALATAALMTAVRRQVKRR
jgi:nucleoside-diphosphate-sugar epimerase